MILQPEDVIRLVLAVLAGGVVGFEREYRDKAAGLRTCILIALGSALFTLLSFRLGEGNDVRIAVGIVSGVGFLGAGVIMRDGGQVTGITTAATIWLVAALGMGMGGGQYLLVGTVVALVVVVLWGLRPLEALVSGLNDERSYCATLPPHLRDADSLVDAFTKAGLKVKSAHYAKKDGMLIGTWKLAGPPAGHQAVQQRLMKDEQVRECSY